MSDQDKSDQDKIIRPLQTRDAIMEQNLNLEDQENRSGESINADLASDMRHVQEELREIRLLLADQPHTSTDAEINELKTIIAQRDRTIKILDMRLENKTAEWGERNGKVRQMGRALAAKTRELEGAQSERSEALRIARKLALSTTEEVSASLLERLAELRPQGSHISGVVESVSSSSDSETTDPLLSPGNASPQPELKHIAAPPKPHGMHVSPLVLAGSAYLAGCVIGLVHDRFYSYYAGREVNSTEEQERNLQIGNFLALLVKLLLSSPVWFVYTQWVWRTLRKGKPMSLAGLDAATSVQTDMFSLFHHELWKLNVGVVLIFIALSLQIPQLITPATLTVVSRNESTVVPSMVPYLNIVNASEARRYAYFTATNATVPSANPSHSTFYGPRTLVMLISTAVASAGQILSLSPPSPRSSYRQTFIGPYIRCGEANATEIEYIDALQRDRNAALEKHQLQERLGYYAFTPSYDINTQNNNTIYPDGRAFTALEQPRLQQVPRNAENEIWLKYYRYQTEASGAFAFAPNGTKIPVASYSICRLWNTTYSINATFQNGIQTVHDTDLEHLHLVEYPDNDPSTPSPLEQQAYTAFMNAVSDQLVGSMALVMSTAANATKNSSYSSVDTSLSHTSLIGSNDLDYAFDLNQVARGVPWSNYTKPRNLSDQRLLDKALAQNQTMPFLIEQVSFNTTVSLMTAPLLAPSRLIDTIQTRRVNIYSYNARNLWLAYGLADFFVLLAILLGIYTIGENNAIHNLMISTILAFSRGPQLATLFPPCRHGKKPASQTMQSQVRLQPMGNGGETIVPASDKEVVF
ncbi:hypothetical protein B0A48_15451 [Cryoendolithus antarcticus]|uniref:Uncharacterized protein n=1 Tax=Cryoendolithus antarcticus TaxID=1507870 RepID=A0A1V8SI19_9PEZI|nr:hypothetical protein B0A48_15451 [Cryoendolithus antarcticus]